MDWCRLWSCLMLIAQAVFLLECGLSLRFHPYNFLCLFLSFLAFQSPHLIGWFNNKDFSWKWDVHNRPRENMVSGKDGWFCHIGRKKRNEILLPCRLERTLPVVWRLTAAEICGYMSDRYPGRELICSHEGKTGSHISSSQSVAEMSISLLSSEWFFERLNAMGDDLLYSAAA